MPHYRVEHKDFLNPEVLKVLCQPRDAAVDFTRSTRTVAALFLGQWLSSQLFSFYTWGVEQKLVQRLCVMLPGLHVAGAHLQPGPGQGPLLNG